MEQEINIPNWLKNKYSCLWQEFRSNSFRMDDAVRVLEEKAKDRKEDIPVFLSELRKVGWLLVESDPQDYRKSIYTLKSQEEIIRQIFEISKNSLGRDDLESLLKKAADLIRTRVDYKFILVLLFLKRIGDKWELEYEQALKEAKADGLNETQARQEAKKAAYHDFDIPEEYLWESIRKDIEHLPEKFSKALKVISERNPDLKDALDNMDFIQFASNVENAEILRQLVELFSEKKLYHVSPDILGDAYEWILRYFAPQKAKEGEVYTPREVISLLVNILDPKPQESVYDPASGSNGMLIISYRHVKDTYGEKKAGKLFLYGQEANQKTLSLGRMNLYIHDIKNHNLALGDTLLYPKFKEGDDVKKFDVVIANPPWNLDGFDEEVLKKGEFWQKRYALGFPPRQSADWAWIQHMLASAKDDTGRVGVVIDNGSLFRGGKEGLIRTKAIEADQIECVILLPEKLFYNTGAPGAIIILNKNKEKKRKDKILFINASPLYEQHPEVRKLNHLSSQHLNQITKIYQEFQEIEGLSRIVGKEEIKSNDYNLNVTLYVLAEEQKEKIDILKEWRNLKELGQQIAQTEEKIQGFLGEIGYK